MTDAQLNQIWLVQPLAFARGGGSDTPCDAFDWGEADLTMHGTGRTRIIPAISLCVDSRTGEVSKKPAAKSIRFKDKDGKIRPVCPFFELHGSWSRDGKTEEGPITPDILASCGLMPKQLRWNVEFCNAKANHWTLSPGDKVTATAELCGDDYSPRPLLGYSRDETLPLVSEKEPIVFGSVQLTCPNEKLPEFRLRFTPGKGLVYGPKNINERLKEVADLSPPAQYTPVVSELFEMNARWAGIELPPENCILNPEAAWPKFRLFDADREVPARIIQAIPDLGNLLTLMKTDMSELLRKVAGPTKDVRNIPPGLYAYVTEPPNAMASLGMIDDFGDGIITCWIDGLDIDPAKARIVSTPPDFAPDRRPVVSIADGLADRVRRTDVRPAKDDPAPPDYTDEIYDMLDRAFETIGLANLDAANDYFQTENACTAQRPGTPFTVQQAQRLLWAKEALDPVDAFPLTAAAQDAHRRNTVCVFFEALVHEYPDFMERFVREPAGPQRLYDRKMPGLMRGGDRMPLHLTRRQYDMMKVWVDSVRARAPS